MINKIRGQFIEKMSEMDKEVQPLARLVNKRKGTKNVRNKKEYNQI
jgi:hypothetical protein